MTAVKHAAVFWFCYVTEPSKRSDLVMSITTVTDLCQLSVARPVCRGRRCKVIHHKFSKFVGHIARTVAFECYKGGTA